MTKEQKVHSLFLYIQIKVKENFPSRQLHKTLQEHLLIILKQDIESHVFPLWIFILYFNVFFMQDYGIAKAGETVYAGKISRNREGIFIKGYAADICTPVRDFLSEGGDSTEHASSP